MASVIAGPGKADSAGNVLIQLGNQKLQVRSTMDLRQGDVLKLQVMRVQPRILLSVVALNEIKPSQSTDPLRSATLQLQPRQGGLPELLSAMKVLSTDHPISGLPAQVSPYLRQLLNAFVTRQEITTSGTLAQAFVNSGLFLESKLLKGTTESLKNRDLKASLLGLLRLLDEREDAVSKPLRRDSSHALGPPHRSAQPEPQPRVHPQNLGFHSDEQIHVSLRELTKAALSRLSLHQIASAENAREGKLRWLTEIPLYDGEQADVLHLCIAKDDYSNADVGAQDCWSAELALDLPALGPMRVRVTLHKGHISSTLWAEKVATVEKLNSELSRLKATLQTRSLKVRSLACYAGKPVTSTRDDQLPSLLDIQV